MVLSIRLNNIAIRVLVLSVKTDWFESHLVGNPEDMTSRDVRLMIFSHCGSAVNLVSIIN